jgi:hypothetical protein
MQRACVNRYLRDKVMDQIDHALGRPVDPLNNARSYRDHYAVSNESTKDSFRSSIYWREGRTSECGMTWFHVTAAGRQALAAHLKAIGDPHRLFEVTFAPGSSAPHPVLIAATSRAAAKYSHWIDIRDALPDLKFGDYCRHASARLA